MAKSNKIIATIDIHIMSKAKGHAEQQLVLMDTETVAEARKRLNVELQETVIPLATQRPAWIVSAKSSNDENKTAQQVTVQELENKESPFYDQLVTGSLNQILVSPPIFAG